jgi:hypothetical protein
VLGFRAHCCTQRLELRWVARHENQASAFGGGLRANVRCWDRLVRATLGHHWTAPVCAVRRHLRHPTLKLRGIAGGLELQRNAPFYHFGRNGCPVQLHRAVRFMHHRMLCVRSVLPVRTLCVRVTRAACVRAPSAGTFARLDHAGVSSLGGTRGEEQETDQCHF